ncbi:uncharacterized protein RHOBADRAFT_51468 [Rhodotorula graminis WP1]|uniref:AB hydrolase-1 domain-containing protein n=1 Tax=Rhodotorula graminis (strain WP1) TaxID=578459 RepID=A0A194SDX0_RHOGW|nr:uncharacterized protein RHOBADRAFT_51468 [Rhodotorula graminis WP1]KPV77641.1 hypothetical protein RHOBADRAFT_51468 [Rhodotorula graminis WP1]
MPSSLVQIRGRPLFVEVAGRGPPLIALHGLGGSTNLFPLADDLSSRFTVVRFDFEGAGQSPLDGETTRMDVEGLVEDVVAVLDYAAPGEDEAVLFGHSLGATVALHLAATHPNRVSRLVLSCPGLARAGNPEAVKMSLALAATARSKGTFEMADFTAKKNLRPSPTRPELALVRTAMQQSSREGYALACEMLARTPEPDWRQVVAPVLLVAGREDRISSVEAAETIRGCLTASKGATVVAVDAGHQPAVECPDVVLALLEDFLA